MVQYYNRHKLHSKYILNYFQNTFWNPHFMHPLFSFSLYSPMNTTPHFKKSNEYKAYRSNKETYKMAKNTHENRNVGMIGVTRWAMIKMWGLAHGSERPKRLGIVVLLCLFWMFRADVLTFFVCVLVYSFMAICGIYCADAMRWIVRLISANSHLIRGVILCRGWMLIHGMYNTLCSGVH